MKNLKLSNIIMNISIATYAVVTSIFAYAADGPQQVAGSAAAPASTPSWINFALIGGIILFMWLFVFRPQAKRAKEQKEFLSSLSAGVEIVSASGLIGTIIEVKDNTILLDLGNNNIVHMLKSAVASKFNKTPVK